MAAVPRLRIESAKNERIKAALRLHERRERERRGRTLIEGVRETSRAADAGVPFDLVFLAPTVAGPAATALAADLEATGVPVLELAEAPFARLSRRQRPDGVVAVAAPPRHTLADLTLPADALLLIAVGTEKPGNLGALARSADAASATALLAVGGAGTDPWNPAAIRASMGSVFSVPTLTVARDEALTWLRERNVAVVATSPAATDDIWDADLTGPVALVLGPEHEGLGQSWLDAADRQVRVPMRGAADSLNVSVTGALLLFEAMRQRRG